MQETSDQWFELSPKARYSTGTQNIDWFAAISVGAGNPVTHSALSKMYDGIQTSLAAGDFDLLDFVLKCAEPQCINTTAIVGLLRYTYAARHKLRHWRVFLEKATDELDTREDVDRRSVLRGLHAG